MKHSLSPCWVRRLATRVKRGKHTGTTWTNCAGIFLTSHEEQDRDEHTNEEQRKRTVLHGLAAAAQVAVGD